MSETCQRASWELMWSMILNRNILRSVVKGICLAKLRKEVKKADKIYLATDPDREGEAISWHLYIALKLENKKVYRITFNEITKNAVKESLKHAT